MVTHCSLKQIRTQLKSLYLQLYKVVLFISIVLTFFSCNNSYQGIVLDSFGNPVPGVKVSIKNSEYSTITDNNGNYQLPVEQDSVFILFEKENYIPINLELNIAENKKREIKDVSIFRKPDEPGLYFINVDSYKKLPRKELYHETEKAYLDDYGNSSVTFYGFENDFKLDQIQPNDSGYMSFLNVGNLSLDLTGLGEDGILFVRIFAPLTYEKTVIKGNFIEFQKKALSEDIQLITFKPKKEFSNYSFIEVEPNDFVSFVVSDFGYSFTTYLN